MTRYCWRCAAALPAVPPTTCTACGEVHYVNPKPCGNAVVVHDGRVLMILRARDPAAGRWTVPGGFCEASEHPRDAAVRELHEEAGVHGRPLATLGAWMDTYGPPDDDGLQIHTVVSGYLCELVDPDAPLRPDPEEALEARWFAATELPEAIAFPAHVPGMVAAGLAVAASGALPRMYDA